MQCDLNFLNCWMQRTDMGNVYLHGDDKNLWSNEEWQHDLISLKPRGADDAFFHWIYETAIHWFNHMLGRHVKVKAILVEMFRSADRKIGARIGRAPCGYDCLW